MQQYPFVPIIEETTGLPALSFRATANRGYFAHYVISMRHPGVSAMPLAINVQRVYAAQNQLLNQKGIKFMRTIRNLLASIPLLLAVTLLPAQTQDNTKEPKVIPPSPDASSLGKYGENPVGLYTGVPSIGIPLYTVNQGDISLPVSLSYHAGGIKTEEMSPWVGLGFSLSAGGVITRSVAGLPDEKTTIGYLYQPYDVENIGTLPFDTIQAIMEKANNRQIDLEPDIFTYSLPGKGGKFIMDKATLKGIASPKENIEIISPWNVGVSTAGWTIKDENGFIYKFRSVERTLYESVNTGTRTSGSFQNYASAWYLTEITSPSGNSISINYQPYTSNYYTRQGGTRYVFLKSDPPVGSGCKKPPFTDEAFAENTITGRRVESITFDNGTVNFIKGTGQREDMPGDNLLEFVEVRNKAGLLVKKFKLHYSYFLSNAHPSGGASSLYPTPGKRLRLDSLSDVTTTGIPPHKFYYETGNLPSLFTYAQDHWGFYNAKGNNSGLIPLTTNTISTNGVDRSVNPSAAKTGTLNRIVYPTGGETNFEYEPNEVSMTVGEYMGTINPYGPISTENREGYSTILDDGNNRDTFRVDSATIDIDEFNNMSYSVFLPDPVNCDGSDRDCLGSLEITLNCIDCGMIDVNGISLTSNPVVNGRINAKGYLTPGRTYLLEKSGMPRTGVRVVVQATKMVLDTAGGNINVPVGGLRLKKMRDKAGFNQPEIVTEYFYNKNPDFIPGGNNTQESSGRLVTPLKYENYQNYAMPNASFAAGILCYYRIMSSSSNLPLSNTSGSVAGYTQVHVFKGSGGEKQKATSAYSFYVDEWTSFPQLVRRSWEAVRGKLLTQKNYSYTNGSYKLVSLDSNLYNLFVPAHYSFSPGMRISMIQSGGTAIPALYVYSLYKLSAEWPTLKTSYATMYDPNGNTAPITKVTNYYYDNPTHLELTRKEETKSDGSIVTSNMLYAEDYPSGNAMTNMLKTKHITGIPVETVVFKQEAGSSSKFITGGSITTFKTSPAGLKDKALSLKNDIGVPLANFKFSNKATGNLPFGTGAGSTYSADARYTADIHFLGYDSKGNLEQLKKDADINVSYLWDYELDYPTAETSNADTLSIAATSFEADGNGNWVFTGSIVNDATSPTGVKRYALTSSAPLSKASLNSTKKYTVSYWSKNGSYTVSGSTEMLTGKTINGWTYYEHTVTGVTSTSISGTGAIDEVRLHPSDAQMTTYTYTPLLGMTSQCDAVNRITYYEYDVMGRLKLVKDQDKNVIKTFDYEYQAPANQ